MNNVHAPVAACHSSELVCLADFPQIAVYVTGRSNDFHVILGERPRLVTSAQQLTPLPAISINLTGDELFEAL